MEMTLDKANRQAAELIRQQRLGEQRAADALTDHGFDSPQYRDATDTVNMMQADSAEKVARLRQYLETRNTEYSASIEAALEEAGVV